MTALNAAPALSAWEQMWSPYDALSYQTALDWVHPDDVVLDIGAGDLRLTHRLAQKAKWVYAIEQNSDLLSADVPENVTVIRADARFVPFPVGVTTAVLLMRHCTHFQLYADKLKTAGCARLVTNARWGMDVECVDLMVERVPFTAVSLGWFACWCGAVGFVPGPPEALNAASESKIIEICGCPHCA